MEIPNQKYHPKGKFQIRQNKTHCIASFWNNKQKIAFVMFIIAPQLGLITATFRLNKIRFFSRKRRQLLHYNLTNKDFVFTFKAVK